TRRRHLEAEHKAAYLAWAKANHFLSMLPKDTAERRKAEAAGAAKEKVQSTLDDDVKPIEKVEPYSDDGWTDAAVDWLIATDQPLSAFEHPTFKRMIDIASRAKHGVKI
ncbi:hypothetical protein BD626DRAFT_388037, partial [Schizophyllum amplum]